MSGLVGRIFLTAVLAGAIAGVFMTAIQHVAVFPMIFEAETYEFAGGASGDGATAHEHEPGAAAHEHDHEGWAPDDGIERTAYSGLANIITAVGFGLLLAVGFALRGEVDWRQGLVWGLAGFLVFNFAPALGLPPELPGAAAADLESRQVWWLLTVLLTAGGLGLIAFAGSWTIKAIGVVLIAVPHVVGAPHPEGGHGGLAPAELEQAFIYASLITNAVFWLALGGMAGLFFERFGRDEGSKKTLATG